MSQFLNVYFAQGQVGGQLATMNSLLPVTSTNKCTITAPPVGFPTDGLIVYFRFDNSPSQSFGTNYNFTSSNITYVTGVSNQAAFLSASFALSPKAGDATLTSSTHLPNGMGSGSYTISQWVYPAPASTTGDILWNWGDVSAHIFLIATASGGNSTGMIYRAYNTAGITTYGIQNIINDGFYAITCSAWNHIVLTNDATVLDNQVVNCCINGQFFPMTGSGPSLHPTASNTQQGIVAQTPGFGSLSHSVDELGIWNRVLSNREITLLYNNGKGFFY